MRVLIAGSSGLVGAALSEHLSILGHDVVPLVRGLGGWNPALGELDTHRVKGYDAVVHLGGAGIADKRWSDDYKQTIRNSRVNSTSLLASRMAQTRDKPKVFVVASAVGIYGSRGSRLLTEEDQPGDGFLADVAREWEAAADQARDAGIRVAHARLGMVLDRRGGALARMRLPFKLGLGGVIGSGEQYWSWITLQDVVRAITHVIQTEDAVGPVNMVAPHAVTCYEFVKTLGRVLKRPAILPTPGFAVKLAMGEMANELLLASTRVDPKALRHAGFTFDLPQLEDALHAVL
ncbi:MAG: TIGR01777 family oxidoreductase [Phycisphaeraceae bacterium JB051]